MQSSTEYEAKILANILENIRGTNETPLSKASNRYQEDPILPRLGETSGRGNKLLWDDRKVFENQKLKMKMIEFKRRLRENAKEVSITIEEDECHMFETLEEDRQVLAKTHKKVSQSSTVSLAIPPLSNRLSSPKRSVVPMPASPKNPKMLELRPPTGKPPIGNFKLNNLKQFQ